MELVVAIQGRRGISRQLYDGLRRAILDGRLGAGEKLPSSREFAGRLNLSRNTVNDAYARLAGEGFIRTRHGSGTFVSPHATARPSPAPAGGETPLRATSWARSLLPSLSIVPQRDLPYDFRPGLPDLRDFPIGIWRRLIANSLRALSPELGHYGNAAGLAELRAAVARYLSHSRAVVCGIDDVLITNGSQQALDLLGRILVEAGATVAVEDPGYPMAAAVFSAMGAKVVGVPVDSEGIRVDRLPNDARIVYVTPSHQFPLGVIMSLARRRALLTWAAARGAVILEDDYDGEFRFGGRPIESLQGLDRSGSVVYLGTFSKVLFPGLRVGYVVAPRWLKEPFAAAKSITDRHTSALEQRAMAAFIAGGHFARYLRRMRRVYGERRDILLAGLRRFGDPPIRFVPSHAGLHLTVMLPREFDTEELIRRAYESGVGLYAIMPFYRGRARPGLIFGYGAIASDDIAEGVRRLDGIWRTVRPGRRAAASAVAAPAAPRRARAASR